MINYIKEFTPKKVIQAIHYPLFPTHLPYTKNKKAPDKYIKINGQRIYSGLHHTQRAPLMNNMHRWYKENYAWETMKCIIDYPVGIGLIFKVPINYDYVSRRNGKIIWKPPKEGFEPGWDVGNYGWIYSKGFLDTLHLMGKIVDDNVKYVNIEGPFKALFCNTLEERELIFIIFKI